MRRASLLAALLRRSSDTKTRVTPVLTIASAVVDIASGYRDLSEPGSFRCIIVRTPFSVSCSVIARTRSLSAASAAS